MKKSELRMNQKMLLARSARLRQAFGEHAALFKKPLSFADSVRAGLQWLYKNPVWPLGALLPILVLRPKRTLVWGLRLWSAWKSFQQAKKWLLSIPRHRLPF